MNTRHCVVGAVLFIALLVGMGGECGVDAIPLVVDTGCVHLGFIDEGDVITDERREVFTGTSPDVIRRFGTHPVLVIMAALDDLRASPVTTEEIDQYFFAEDRPSIRGYFDAQSFGRFTIERAGDFYPGTSFTVLDWVDVGRSGTEYLRSAEPYIDSNGNGRRDDDEFFTDVEGNGRTDGVWDPAVTDGTWNRAFWQDVLNAAVLQHGIDFTDYDVDENGTVDGNELQIVVVTAGGVGGGTRPHAFPVRLPMPRPFQGVAEYATIDVSNAFVFVGINSAGSAGPYAPSHPGRPFGDACHELCHALFGLPDRYLSFCGTGYGGAFDLMSDNCRDIVGMNPYDKLKLGWLLPMILTKNNLPSGCIAIPPVPTAQPSTLILWDPLRSPDGSEYFIVEYRLAGATDYDNTPEDGLAIWVVNEDLPESKRSTIVPWQSAGMSPINAVQMPEPYSDIGMDGFVATGDAGEGNGQYDAGEPFTDRNTNGMWDPIPGFGAGSLFYDRGDLALVEDAFVLRYGDGTPSRFLIEGVSDPGAVMHFAVH